jgi:RNA polymerase sigma-70 factor (ECF subfamily)
MESVVAEYESALLNYAARILHYNRAAAQDVVQNVFIKLFRRRDAGYDLASDLKSWLYRVTHNEAVDHIRRESRLRLLHTRHQAAEAVETRTPGAGLARRSHAERVEVVLGLLTNLHPREQQVVLLRLQQGLSYEEISRVTGRSGGNVGNILHHAVRKLAQALRRGGALDT